MASDCITSSLFPRPCSSSWSLFPLVSPSSLKLAAQVNAELENYCHILLVSPNLSYHILGNYQKHWPKVAVKNDVSGTAIIQYIAYLSTMTLQQISVELGQKKTTDDWRPQLARQTMLLEEPEVHPRLGGWEASAPWPAWTFGHFNHLVLHKKGWDSTSPQELPSGIWWDISYDVPIKIKYNIIP